MPTSLNIEMTDGRMSTRPSLLMVFEIRSGIEMSRFEPMALSLRKPEMA